MDSVHMSWGWLVAVALLVGCAGAVAVALDDGGEVVDIAAVTASSGSDVIDVLVQHRACGAQPEVALAEDDAIVSLRAVYDDAGDCDDALVDSTVSVDLVRPLGSRSIEVRSRTVGSALYCSIDGAVSDRCFRG